MIPMDDPSHRSSVPPILDQLDTARSPDGRQAWLNWAVWCNPEYRHVGYVQATITASGRAFIAYALFRDAWDDAASEWVVMDDAGRPRRRR